MLKNRFLVVLILAYVALSTGYSIIIPLGEAPDEVSHFAYVQSLAIQHQLPGAEGAASGQAHQAPNSAMSPIPIGNWRIQPRPIFCCTRERKGFPINKAHWHGIWYAFFQSVWEL